MTLGLKYKIINLILGQLGISSWRVGSVHASVPDPYAQGMHQFLMRMLSMFEGTALCARISTWCVCSVQATVPDSYALCMHQFLTCTLSVSGVPDPYAQRAPKGQSMRVRNSIFLIIFKVHKTAKNLKNPYIDTKKMVLKASRKYFFCPNSKKNPP